MQTNCPFCLQTRIFGQLVSNTLDRGFVTFQISGRPSIKDKCFITWLGNKPQSKSIFVIDIIQRKIHPRLASELSAMQTYYLQLPRIIKFD